MHVQLSIDVALSVSVRLLVGHVEALVMEAPESVPHCEPFCAATQDTPKSKGSTVQSAEEKLGIMLRFNSWRDVVYICVMCMSE